MKTKNTTIRIIGGLKMILHMTGQLCLITYYIKSKNAMFQRKSAAKTSTSTMISCVNLNEQQNNTKCHYFL